MTQEYDRLFAALMGYKLSGDVPTNGGVFIEMEDHHHELFFASLGGEATKEVRDFMAKEMPEWWEKYLDDVYCSLEFPNLATLYTTFTRELLSIQNLTAYIMDHWQEMFWEECPTIRHNIPEGNDYLVASCWNSMKQYCLQDASNYCVGTGRTIIPRFEGVVKIIRRELDEKDKPTENTFEDNSVIGLKAFRSKARVPWRRGR